MNNTKCIFFQPCNLQTPDRQYHLDLLRIAATFSVMILHISGQNLRASDYTSLEWHIFNIYDSSVRWGVPVFTMISGALFLSGKHSIKKIYQKNIVRIVTAFCFWSLIYAIGLLIEGADKKTVIRHFFTGNYHMWFLFMIAGLYMLVPLLKKITEHKFLMNYFLVLALIFNFMIPQLLSVISLFSDYLESLIRTVLDNTHMNFVLGYTSYFLLGYALNQKNLTEKTTQRIYIAGIFGFLSTILLSEAVTIYAQKPNVMFYDNFTVNILLESIFIFSLFKKHFRHRNFSPRVKIILYRLSKYSFGAYLVHALILRLCDVLFHFNTLSLPPTLSVPVLFLVVCPLSFAFSALFNHIPGLKQYV